EGENGKEKEKEKEERKEECKEAGEKKEKEKGKETGERGDGEEGEADGQEEEAEGGVVLPKAKDGEETKKVQKIVFDEELGREEEFGGKRLKRYQTNPRPNWGPMSRAKAGGSKKASDAAEAYE
ncbi:MAG: hypothetical protein Q9157_006888, partial [Trypethelium eluteriae]